MDSFLKRACTVLQVLCVAGLALVLSRPSLQGTTPEQVEAARARLSKDEAFATKLAHAALDRTKQTVRYEPAYVRLDYPNGDVPADTGVCTDEVIRSYRILSLDLQKLVHEDMKRNFSAYPRNWGLSRPDPNIDHRRVPNLQTFFKRKGASLPVTDKPEDYLPGDLITCTVPPHLPHIAIVVPAPDGGPRPWIVHNIGSGPKMEDRLFDFPLTGHYRWTGK
ncbi:DUF1287 domain-containing protein [Roseimicrobium sp. ORNL1]|uniref:DUF1287 domain-containing protein n=1 Tax=Roseimicrobium sp. ORNL1 TaxID=2711231 RepID=UPI0013E10AB8|nr:DUF1287 domain-containing protein [Roseimicrobium sp. ORNL1]QIF01463.1 DUF1287 domain-containing protein [Roseimicrobium sp. ORNL1]